MRSLGLMKSSGRKVLEQYKQAINFVMMQCCCKFNHWQLFFALVFFMICESIVLNYVCVWLVQLECVRLAVGFICVDYLPGTAIKNTGAFCKPLWVLKSVIYIIPLLPRSSASFIWLLNESLLSLWCVPLWIVAVLIQRWSLTCTVLMSTVFSTSNKVNSLSAVKSI